VSGEEGGFEDSRTIGNLLDDLNFNPYSQFTENQQLYLRQMSERRLPPSLARVIIDSIETKKENIKGLVIEETCIEIEYFEDPKAGGSRSHKPSIGSVHESHRMSKISRNRQEPGTLEPLADPSNQGENPLASNQVNSENTHKENLSKVEF
jgi:hypothetical protein